jgi:ABC-type transporter Mla subunit MlaD
MRLPAPRQRLASQQRSKPFMAALGLLGIGIFLLFAWIGFQAPNAIPGRSYYYLYAQFKSADNLTYHSQVRVDGDVVGQVLNPTVANGIATVKLQMSPSVAPLRADSTVAVLPRSAVGVRYLEITPGLHGSPLPSGGTIGYRQTSSTTQLDTVLGTFDPATRVNLQRFLRNFGEGLAGQGQNLNDTLRAAPSFEMHASDVLGAVGARAGATASLVHGAGTIASAADPVRDSIASGFRPEAQALRPFADRASRTEATLAAAPPALTAVQTRMPAFDALAAQVSGFATAIRPGLQAGPAAFSQTSALLSESKPALVDAQRVLNVAGKAVGPVLDLLHTVRPVLTPLRSGLKSAIPIVSTLGAHGCDFVRFGTYWTSMQAFGNSQGNVLRFLLTTPDVSSAYGATTPSADTFSDPYPAPCVAGHETLP